MQQITSGPGSADLALAPEQLATNSGYGSYADIDPYADGKPLFDIREIIATIRANLIVISAIVAASLALAVIVTMLQTLRYTAQTTLQINDQSAQILGKQDDTLQDPVVAASDTERFLQTQVDILKSRALTERVAQRLRLVGNARFYDAMGVRQPTGDLSRAEVKDLTIRTIEAARDVDLPRNTRLATVSFVSTQPELAAQIANAFAAEFIQTNLQRRFDSSAYAREFISGQLAEARAKLERSERELNAYARDAGLIRDRDASTGAQSSRVGSSVTTTSLLEVNSTANQAQANRIAMEGRWTLISRGNPLDSPDVLANPAVSQLLAERARNMSELEKQRANHLEDYPAVQQLKAQVGVIDAQIQNVARSIRASVKQQYDAAVDAEKSLKRQVAELKSSSLAEQDQLVQYRLLEREADTNRTVYEGLLQRYKELNAAAGISASNIAIIDTAVAPIRPSSPNLLRNLLLALVLGIISSAIVIYLRTLLDDSVKVPEDVEGKLQLPLLGVIPLAQELEINLAMEDPKSPISEGYNSLRSALLYSTAAGLPKTLLVTSSQPSEGKSTTSLAIAKGIARLGRSVVLLDVDLRRPALHRTIPMLNGENELGVTSILTAQSTVEEALRDTDVDHLKIITSGPIPPSPTELISSKRMTQLIEELSEKFDLVLLDSPPVLGLADSPLMAALVDGVVIVIQSDRSRRGSLKASLRRLRSMRTNILGAALTKFDPNDAGNRYSEYYGYNYYHYSNSAAN
ncbi:polysaccharide biosynthesis tyrosine autokinase [Novosphingobium sp. AAP93]|uniref:GumC family protein n=1 Tax=Novosphingobium sp. AAP93 TaxID=1523427 RepID=UPI000AE98496|nr:polysaccharide biosynthesis tyrosine autokinase [Novosphingobium sp. AAP93]